jgi:hypothetical protein
LATEPTKRSNIVLLMADDLGSWAVSAYGNKEIHTPHIDALAVRGTRFTSFYCTSPVCSPARASLLTGQMPSVHGVHDWILPASPTAQLDRFLEGQETFVDALVNSGHAYPLRSARVCACRGLTSHAASWSSSAGFPMTTPAAST